ncbi:MAG: hypothetical protein IIZ39_04720 [Blautia sp.]|nr:hypothetical protein [Blautia sp.]
MSRHALEEHAVDALDHLILLRVDNQIPVLASVVAEEPLERAWNLAICKTLSLALHAVLGNGPTFFLSEARHDGQQDLPMERLFA